ncbi:sugar nucleotide-binding protein [Candidatus Woesearchaeota archaeon]|nr:sugar nucleotide-binding protein [Candidatus Woesearchaeota archaeon]
MKYKNILLTGASGKLGKAIATFHIFPSLLTPSREILDITQQDTIKKFFDNNNFDAVVHCAALARMRECEENPTKAIETNIIGTSNLVNAVISKERKSGKKIRFVHISTDGVYPGIKGNYSEKDETVPYNTYGWTKLGAECAANSLSNFCIIRTSFFDPENIKFDDASTDAYSSKAPISYVVKAILTLLNSSFIGTINVGRERRTDYEHYKEFKPKIKKCKLLDIKKTISFRMYKDASMDISLWKKIEKKNETNKK